MNHTENIDALSKALITNHIQSRDFFDIEVYDEVDSTNTMAKDFAIMGSREGTVLVANSQNSGRGRLGRNFYSPSGTGIYLSLILRPKNTDNLNFYTPLAAVAVCKAIEKVFHKNPQIKWVNDIFIDNLKVSGILTETSFSQKGQNLDFLVIGIGINVYKPKDGFTDETKNIAGYISETVSSGQRSKLVAEILNEIHSLYLDFDTEYISKEYKKLSFIIGTDVYTVIKNEKTKVHVLDINEKNELIVKSPTEEILVLSSGEISIKLM